MHFSATKFVIPLGIAIALVACGDEAAVRRRLSTVGPQKLRSQTLEVCREGFASGVAREVPNGNWPESARAFHPLSLWAEPDGAYLLIESDADGERGIYLPRIVSEKDPLCSPVLEHVKLAQGVYWYDRKRS